MGPSSLFVLLLFLLLFTGIHYLGYRRVVRRLHITEKLRTFLTLLVILNSLGTLLYLGGRYFVDMPPVIYLPASLSIAVGFLILFGSLFYELLYVIQTHIPFSPARRTTLKRGSDLLFLGSGVAYMGYGLFNGETRPEIERITVHQGHFRKPVTIAQISDLHIGGLIDRSFVRRIVERINREKVDLVAITGDLIDTSIDRNREAVGELFRLRSRYGTYYVVGNHEYFHGIESIINALKNGGISVLDNRSEALGDFHIVGVHDLFGLRFGTHRPDFDKAFSGIAPDAPTLLLMHQPRGIYALGHHAPSLILSGHTHGGQLWPFGRVVSLVQPYLKGLHSLGERRAIYVNRGVGFWGPPMRIGAQAELTILEWS